jgi:hypothetical protein
MFHEIGGITMEDCIKISTAMDCAKNTEMRSATEYLNSQYAEGWNDACKCIKELISLQCPEDVEPTHRWIPCSERLPEDGQYVLCWYQYFRYGNYNRLWQTYGIGFQYNGNWGGEVSTGRDTKVLFWMPLPEPPEEEQNGRT